MSTKETWNMKTCTGTASEFPEKSTLSPVKKHLHVRFRRAVSHCVFVLHLLVAL
jgi:hypothetical protein